MDNGDIVRRRLRNQRLAGEPLAGPADVVAWLGAVQAQDFPAALWALGLRSRAATEAAVEAALAERTIIRTWPMRGTLHFVPAADARWMLALMAQRVVAGSAGRYRQLGLDEAEFARSRQVVEEVLRGGRQLTRSALYEALNAAGIETGTTAIGSRALHILGRLAMDGVICFGTREGKQHTFALLDEWVPPDKARTMDRDEALGELAGRYFASHGPATAHDFAWWSGLTLTDARAAAEMIRPRLAQEEIGGQTYWLADGPPAAAEPSPTATLLPAYDEYTVAYKDRAAVIDPAHADRARSGGILWPAIVVDGQVVGIWKRTLNKAAVEVTFSPFASLSKAEEGAVAAAAERYGAFLERPVAAR